jgi:hypothetical protein
MQINTQVGPQALATGTIAPQMRGGASGEVVMQELHGRYYESAVRKQIFSGANLAGVTTTAAFATTYTGFVLFNPIGSTVNLVLNKVSYVPILAQASVIINLGIMTGFNPSSAVTIGTALVAGSNFVGSPAGAGLIGSAATLSIAPTRLILLDSVGTAATTQSLMGKVVDMEGSVVIPGGGFAAFYTSAASTASSLGFGMQWEEVSNII